jgi:hypothetical protein
MSLRKTSLRPIRTITGRPVKKAVCALMALACAGAMAVEWNGHLATLFDAQVSCTDMLSLECRPFLAEAVAFVEVFSEIAKPDERRTVFSEHGCLFGGLMSAWATFLHRPVLSGH